MGNTMAIAGDRGVTVSQTIRVLSKPKVAKAGKYLVGYYGSMEGQRFLELFKFPEPPSEPDETDVFMDSVVLKDLQRFYEEHRFDVEDQDNGLGLLIMVNGRIYEHDICDGSMTRYEGNFSAVGSGGTIALGALTAKWRSSEEAVRHAVTAAVEYNVYCRPPVDIITLRLPRQK